LFDRWNLVVDIVAPLGAFNLAGLLGLAYDFRLERKQRQQLRGYLQRYFSPDVVDLMLRDPEHFRTLQRGANRVITVLFSDLRGFTSMSETLSPEELVKQLNHYFNRMVQIIHGHSGGIDKFIGDAIMAVWGWVGSDTSEASIRQTAIHAVTTTLKMREGLRDLNAEWQAEGKPALKIGVGIHQGPAIVGDLGSETQSGFTVIGDSVNTASRLEGTTKEYGVDNIISDTVCAHVRDRFICRSADLVRVKGKMIPVPVFTVMHEIEHGPIPGLDKYEEAMSLYRAGSFADALKTFQAAAIEGLHDELTTIFIKRCEALINTPPDTWDGVFTMTKK
jgi:adenylate cyclase